MIRFLLIIAVFITITCGHPKAATELCGATVLRVLPIHTAAPKTDLGTDTLFGYQLRADVPRTVSGKISIYAGANVYQVAFSNVSLTLHKKQWRERTAGIMGYTEAQSEPLYFRFDAPQKVDAIWVSEAGAGGGHAECPSLPITSSALDAEAWFPEEGAPKPEDDVRSRIPLSPPKATLDAHIDVGACKTLFKDADLLNAITPPYPSAMGFIPRTVLVKVVIASTGKVVDAWTLGSSGDTAIDESARQSAVASTYAPAQFLCVPIPGIYLFRAHFEARRP